MENKKNTCFIMMPISDPEGYEKGHFRRVYEHLIKPACEKANFIPTRADEEVKANLIVLDIIRKILDSDIIICDLSSKNPNVMYELGIRQAFNKKSILIKDIKTNRVFDIQGMRTIDYDHNLRIDEVQKSINDIALALRATHEEKGEDVNSLIQLLSIKPASIPNSMELSKESSLILDVLNDISNRLSKIENKSVNKTSTVVEQSERDKSMRSWLGDKLFDGTKSVGVLVDIHGDSIFLQDEDKLIRVSKTDPMYKRLDPLPF